MSFSQSELEKADCESKTNVVGVNEDSESQALQDNCDFPDGGLQAWLVVLGCFIITAVTIGFSLCWGVFQAFYSEHTLPNASPFSLSLIGSLPGGLMSVLAVVTGKLADRYQYRLFIMIGCLLWVIFVLGTAFSTKLWHFMLIQGILQGIADGFIYPLTASLPSQWFFKRRALATGIVLSGAPFGGAAASALTQVMLSRFGLRNAMFIKAGTDAVTLVFAFLLIKERKVIDTNSGHRKIVWYDKKFLTDPIFWSIVGCMYCCSFGYQVPNVFLPTYAKQNIPNLSDILSALPLTVLNVSSGIGCCFAGFIADIIGVTNSLFAFAMLSGMVQLLMWNFVHDYPGIMIFSALYGLVSMCFWTLIPPVAARLFGIDKLATLSGLFFAFGAPGELAGAPIGGAIFSSTSSWHCVVGFSGTVQVLGALCLIYARLKRCPKLWTAF